MNHHLDLEDVGPPGQVEVEIRYHYSPPDPVTLCQRCGYEPPGAGAAIELTDVRVVSWSLDGRTATRNDEGVIWTLLDAYAMAIVLRDWDHYHALAMKQSVMEN